MIEKGKGGVIVSFFVVCFSPCEVMDYKLKLYQCGSSRCGRGTKFQQIQNLTANINYFQDVTPVSKETVLDFFFLSQLT